ncbi:MAG: hypothetical protein PHI19_06145, partial [Clostridia bacterium]|nr:hypothetical protein [Clostridia bacterium]
PWEWEYGYHSADQGKVWAEALKLGATTSIKGAPCDRCSIKIHCGAWDSRYAGAFNGAGLKAVEGEYPQAPGYYFDQNPANKMEGWV